MMEKVKDLSSRLWYMEQTLARGWSRNVLAIQIEAQTHARQTLKDPYIFDFLTLEEPFHERELSASLDSDGKEVP